MPNARMITLAVVAVSAVASLGFVSQPVLTEPQGSANLHRSMEDLADSLMELRVALENGETEAALQHLEMAQKAVIGAKATTPEITAEYEGEERDAQNADFRKRLVGVLRSFCDVEVLIIDGDTEAAITLLKGEIGEAENEGHTIFSP